MSGGSALSSFTSSGAKISDLDGNPIARPSKTITWDAAQAEKGGYPHFMLKEIHEQPRAIADTLRARLRLETSDADLEGFEVDAKKLRRLRDGGYSTNSFVNSGCLQTTQSIRRPEGEKLTALLSPVYFPTAG